MLGGDFEDHDFGQFVRVLRWRCRGIVGFEGDELGFEILWARFADLVEVAVSEGREVDDAGLGEEEVREVGESGVVGRLSDGLGVGCGLMNRQEVRGTQLIC
jgi:hypothetical protein